jgi:hypothetical protein
VSEQRHVEELIAAIPCRIELPEEWSDFFTRTGPLPPTFEDERRFRRFYLRRHAALRCRATLPGLQRPKTTHRIFLKDICRASLSFVHSEQLFPRESVELLMADGSVFPATVIRCVRHRQNCYEVAATFNTNSAAADVDAARVS